MVHIKYQYKYELVWPYWWPLATKPMHILDTDTYRGYSINLIREGFLYSSLVVTHPICCQSTDGHNWQNTHVESELNHPQAKQYFSILQRWVENWMCHLATDQMWLLHWYHQQLSQLFNTDTNHSQTFHSFSLLSGSIVPGSLHPF